MRRLLITTFAALAGLGASTLAAAQDVDIRIRVQPDVIRQVTRSVETVVVPELQQQILVAIHGLVPVLSDVAMMAQPARGRVQDREFRFEQTKRETKTIPLGPSGAVDLDNFGGDITVTAGSGRDVTIEITRVSRGRTQADADQGLEQVTVEVEQRGNRATVKTRYPQQDRRTAFRVHATYNVTAPAGTAVGIKSLGGNIRVKGIHGDLSANTAGGNVEIADAGRISQAKTLGGNITLTDVDSDGTVAAETFGGNVTLQGVKARRLVGSTTGGDVIAREITSDSVELGSLGGSVEFSGNLVRNGRYDLHTTGGNVRFVPSGSVGFELDASTFAGEIRSDLPLQSVGAPTGRGPRRTWRATSGDGSALVKATTLSGNVIVGKK
jgi:DUF4097 and DUF4098 domain-containing protein YvlB